MLDRRQAVVGIGALAAAAMAPSPLFAAVDAPSAEGWRPLFNGNDLEGWTFFHDKVGDRDVHSAVSIEDGVLHFLGPGFDRAQGSTMGHIATVDAWRDYHLRLEFRWGSARFSPRSLQRRNSGILYHMGPERGRLFPDCVEFQVEEGDVGDAVMVNTKALQGPLLGGTPLWPNWIEAIPRVYEEPLVAGKIARQWFRHAGQYEKLDDWNTLDLFAFGDQAAHLVNGRIVMTLFSMIGRGGAAGAATRPLSSGRIALEFEAAEVFFRNVMIRSLDREAIALLKAG
jgi:hypothetical protein